MTASMTPTMTLYMHDHAYIAVASPADIVFIISVTSSFSLITTGTCNYDVDWGDGTAERVIASGTFTQSHSYLSAGIYNVAIRVNDGTFIPFYNNNGNGDLILSVTADTDFTFSGSFEDSFYGSANLSEFNADLSGVTSLFQAFISCPSLTTFNNSPLLKDLSNVTNIRSAFINTGSISFNGFNLSGLTGSQSNSNNSGVFGDIYSPSKVVSIGTETEPIVFGTTGGNTFGLERFARNCSSLTQVYFDSGVKITSLFSAFESCTSLVTFEVQDKNLSNVTNIRSAFINTGSISFNGFNLSGLAGSQSNGINLGVFGYSIKPSQVVSIGTATEPIVFGTTGGNTFDLLYFASYCPSLTQVCFDSGVKITSLFSAFYYCESLATFEVQDKNLSNVTNIRSAFINTGSISFNGFNLSGLAGSQSNGIGLGVFGYSIKPSQVVSIGTATEPIVFGTTGGNTFSLQYFANYCPSLTQVCFDSGVKITSLYQAFYRCSSLDFFDVIDDDLSNVTNIQAAFIGTGSLELKGLKFEGLSGSQQFSTTEGVFGSSGVPSQVVSIGTATEPIVFGTTGGNTFSLGNFAYFCSLLTQAYFDSGVKITSLYRAFYGCSSLNFFDVTDKNLSNVTNIQGAFVGTGSISFDGFNLSSLTSTTFSTSEGAFGSNIRPSKVTSIGSATEPIVFGTTGGNTFSLRLFAFACSFLTQVHFDSGVKITDWYRAFYNCSSLTTFRNLDVATGFTNVTTMQDAFFGCALDAASIENILVSCDNGGKTGIILSLSGGTNAIYSTWTAAAQTALSNLQAKSWTITYRT